MKPPRRTKRHLVHVLCLFGAIGLCAPRAHATGFPSASDTVRHLFSAIAKHDFPTALSMTTGPAETNLASLLGSVEREASRAHAKVELVVRDLKVWDVGVDDAGRQRVEAHYDVAIFGKKFLFRALARRLVGTARFVVSDAHIVGFDPPPQ